MKTLRYFLTEQQAAVVNINSMIEFIIDELWESYLSESNNSGDSIERKIISISEKITERIFKKKSATSEELYNDTELTKDITEFLDLVEKNAGKFLSEQSNEYIQNIKEIFNIY